MPLGGCSERKPPQVPYQSYQWLRPMNIDHTDVYQRHLERSDVDIAPRGGSQRVGWWGIRWVQ